MILFWVVIFLLLVTCIYQFVPSAQIYVDDKWHGMSSHLRKWNHFVEDESFEVPDHFQPTEAFKEFHYKKLVGHENWGSPAKDGPSKTVEGCWWIQGMQYCNKKQMSPEQLSLQKSKVNKEIK